MLSSGCTENGCLYVGDVTKPNQNLFSSSETILNAVGFWGSYLWIISLIVVILMVVEADVDKKWPCSIILLSLGGTGLLVNEKILKKACPCLLQDVCLRPPESANNLKVNGRLGMPSGHSFLTAYLATIGFSIKDKLYSKNKRNGDKYLAILLSIWLITIWSRIRVKDHTFVQVSVGSVLGCGLGMSSSKILESCIKEDK
jgi:membrane-associated phospholipid phosphatase